MMTERTTSVNFLPPVSARVIVCERTGCWAVALRRELAALEKGDWQSGKKGTGSERPEKTLDMRATLSLGACPLFPYETRSLTDCWAALSHSPASLAVIELHPRAVDDLLRRLATFHRDFPAARLAIVAPRSLAAYQWLMREAGATHFTCSPRQLAPLAQLALRHLAQAPVSPQTATERIWASLPWGRASGSLGGLKPVVGESR